MKIHEYQAKELLGSFNVPVLRNAVVFSADDAGKAVYDEFVTQGVETVVVKAQVHAGGRGKGYIKNLKTDENREYDGKAVRGVNLVTGGDIAHKTYEIVKRMIGSKLVTIQTGESGTVIRKVLIEEGCDIAKEFYAGIVLDRETGMNTVMVSTEGGVEIEKVAAETPEKILKEPINPKIGFQGYQARRLAFGLGLSGKAFKSFLPFIANLVKAYDQLDCSLVEINPLVLSQDGDMIALDAKMNFDDNAMFRHKDYVNMRDTDEEAALEVEASKFDLNYIKLDGNVGCMVNGAGLAMSTMDLIKLSGGEPANFLDVGGGANPVRIANAFRIMMSDDSVRAVLINIFGGIVRCDKVADGILQALKDVRVEVPVIVRLDGTNAEEAAEKLKKSELEFKVASTFEEAAKKVTEVVAKN